MTQLTLYLSDNTLKKLRALAMLSGSTVDQLEQELVQYFDRMLSDNIATLLAQLDGKEYPTPTLTPEETFKPFTPPKPDLKEAASDWKMEERAQMNPIPAPSQPEVAHSLSEDDLPEEVKSAAEEVESEEFQLQIHAPNAGDDAEAYLAGMGILEKPRPSQQSFSPVRRKVKVSEYTGAEDGNFG